MLTPIAPPNYWPLRSTSSTSVTVTAGDGTVLYNNTSDATVSLPSAATVPGQIFAVKKVSGNAHTVTLDPSGSETIDGATSYVLYIVGDYVVIQSDGTNWRVVGGYLTPHSCSLIQTFAQSISAATVTVVDFDSTLFDVGGLADLANNGIVPRRTGSYLVIGQASIVAAAETIAQLNTYVFVNGAQAAFGREVRTGGILNTEREVTRVLNLTAGDLVTLRTLYSGVTGPKSTNMAVPPHLDLLEIR